MAKIIYWYEHRSKKKEAKNDFGKDFFKLMNNSVSGKSMENKRELIGIKLVTTECRRNCLVSETNYHTTKFSQKICYQ